MQCIKEAGSMLEPNNYPLSIDLVEVYPPM